MRPSPFRSLNIVCTALAGCVLVCAALSWFLVDRAGVRPVANPPEAVELSLTFLAASLVLLSSRLRGSALRRALPRRAELPIDPDAILSAYRRGTLLSFALLEAAGFLGLLVAMISGKSFYGVVLCAAAGLAMLTRWPREGELDRIVRGRLVP
jgi:hypothetical protein